MKKRRLFSVAVLSMILLFALAPVHAQEVSPTYHNFGDVEVGTSVTTIITLTNTSFSNITISHIAFVPSSGDFSQTSGIQLPISLFPGEFIYVEVTFTPSSVGEFSADLVIHNSHQFVVPIAGTGVGELPPPTSIQDILSFFDASVVDGYLVGAGSGSSADGRLNALRNMLIQAGYLLSAGNLEGACDQLSAALKRCNDFVQGTAQNELKLMISDLMNDLGC